MGMIKTGLKYFLIFLLGYLEIFFLKLSKQAWLLYLKNLNSRGKFLWIAGLSFFLVIIEGDRIDPLIADLFPNYSLMQPTGAIIIGSPSVFTRERLINSRLRKRDWLEEQLQYTLHQDDSSKARRDKFNFTHSITDIRKSTSAEISTGEQGNASEEAKKSQNQVPLADNASENQQDTSKKNDTNSQLTSEIPTEFQFSMLKSYREKVDHEWLKTQLDDRHDIAGNTIAQLSFDVSVFVPPNSTESADDKIAWIRMSAGQEEHKLKDRISVLLEDWRKYLQQTTDSAIADREMVFLGNSGDEDIFNEVIALSLESFSQDPLIRRFFSKEPKTPITISEKLSIFEKDNASLIDVVSTTLPPFYWIKLKDIDSASLTNTKEIYPSLLTVSETRKKLHAFFTEYRKHIDISIQYIVANKRLETMKDYCGQKKKLVEGTITPCKEIKVYKRETPDRFSSEIHPYEWDLIDYHINHPTVGRNAKLLQDKLCRASDTANKNSKPNRHPICITIDPENTFSNIYPIIKLLEFRSLLLNSGYSYLDEEHNDFYFPSNPPRKLLKRVIKFQGAPQQSEIAKSGFNTFIKENCADRTFINPSSPPSFKTDVKNIFCVSNIRSERKKYLALLSAAETLNDLKQKELDKIFDIKLSQCFDDECGIKISPPVNHPVNKCVSGLLKRNTEIYAYDVRGETSKANRVNRQVSNILKLSALSSNTVANKKALLELINKVDKKDWRLNQEVIGYAISPQDNSGPDKKPFPKPCLDLGMKPRKVEGAHGNDSATQFGWLIRPIDQPTGGIAKYPVNTLLSVPSWYQTLKLTVNSCWIRARDIGKTYDSDSYKDQETPDFCIADSGYIQKDYTIQLPHDIKDISHKLRFYVVDAPNLTGVSVDFEQSSNQNYAAVMEGKEASIILIGERLWRNPYVYLGAQKASSVNVLPDMTGLIARFDCVERPTYANTTKEHLDRTGTPPNFIRIWTSENKTNKRPVTMVPYNDQNGTPPCYLKNKTLVKSYIDRHADAQTSIDKAKAQTIVEGIEAAALAEAKKVKIEKEVKANALAEYREKMANAKARAVAGNAGTLKTLPQQQPQPSPHQPQSPPAPGSAN